MLGKVLGGEGSAAAAWGGRTHEGEDGEPWISTLFPAAHL